MCSVPTCPKAGSDGFLENAGKWYQFQLYTSSLQHRMDSFVAAGDESAERSQVATGHLTLSPILSRIEPEFPALIAAEEALTRAILESADLLSASDQRVLLATAGDAWPGAISDRLAPFSKTSGGHDQSAVVRFGRKLARYGPWCTKADCDELTGAGYPEIAVIAAVALVALGHFRCTVAAHLLGPEWLNEKPATTEKEKVPQWKETTSPFFSSSHRTSDALDFAFAQIRALFGFVPSLVQLQSWVPNLLATEVRLLDAVFGPEEHLSQIQKHRVAFRLAAANCSNYLVALHGEMLTLIGSTPNEILDLFDNPEAASLPEPDRALCSEITKLRIVQRGGYAAVDRKLLVNAGLTEAQIVEGIVTAAFTNLLSTLQFGLGATPDFPPARTFHVKDLYLSEEETRPTQNENRLEDPDIEIAARVKAGETDAFEQLVRSHTRRVFRTLYGLVGNAEEARDATQDTFLKAFEHIDKFEGRSKFSTWLTSIAVNTGTEILRRRRPVESLDIEDDEHGFRPRQVRSWVDNPEEALAKSQMDDLVRQGVLRLPEKYRTALLLRDINQLSTEDAAEAMGLSLPATKARILRGRLMLRESLAPHLSKSEGDRHV